MYSVKIVAQRYCNYLLILILYPNRESLFDLDYANYKERRVEERLLRAHKTRSGPSRETA